MNHWLPPVLGALLLLIGAVWILQGANVIGGSNMSGSRLWLVIGILAVIAGVALLARAARSRTSS